MAYEKPEIMEKKEANARYEFFIEYKNIADSIKNQVQRGYSKVTDYIDNIFKIKDSIKTNYNNTIDSLVEKYKYNKKKDELDYQFSY